MSPLTRRWVGACALAEAVGMTAAAGAATLSHALVGEPVGARAVAVALTLVVAGGLVEGTSLGTAQSWALRATHPHHARGRLVAVTVLFAGLGWAAASAPATLSSGTTGGPPPATWLVVLGGAGLGLVMGGLLGAVQARVLAPAVRRPLGWVAANVLAWVPAMAVIFAGATSPDASWAWWQVLPLGALTGAVAGAVLGLVLGSRVPRLGVRTEDAGRVVRRRVGTEV